MAAPTMFDDVDKLRPDEYPDEGTLTGMLLNDDGKLDWRDDGNEFPNPPCIPLAPCIW